MFSTFIKTADLAQRIDPEHHSPHLLSMKKRVQEIFPTSTFRNECSRMNSGPFGSALLSSAYVPQDTGVLLVRPQDCKNLIVDDDNDNVYISKKDSDRLKSSQFSAGAIIITKIGNGIGDMAVLPKNIEVCNISGNAMGAMLNKHDSYFAVSFLRGKYGQAEVKRGLSGGAKPKIDMYSIGSIVFPLVNTNAQKYIGDKVRQAEQLRAWAKYTQTNANVLIPAYINEIERYQHKSYRTVKLNPERLDSLFYHPDYIALESIMKSKGCKNLGLIATLIKQAWNKKRADNFEYFEIGGLDIGTGQVASANIETSSAPSRAKTKVQQGDVLVSTVRPNRKNVGFIIENANDVEMVATSGFSVLRFSSLKEAAFYHAWLRTDDATSQLMRWNSGSAYPAIDDNIPLNIIVPEFDKDFIDEWGQKLLDAQFAYVYAKQLTNAAKALVEALIEGQLTEEQLIQAQQALEDGDNTLDKAILNKLSSEGYAVEGAAPLFSDLDELYRLLASANADDDSED